MEKVYMEVPKKKLGVWKSDDVSPYDFRDDVRNEFRNDMRNELRNEVLNDRLDERYMHEEDEHDMDAIMDELDKMGELQDECNPENDMYDYGNIDWRCNEDISQQMSQMNIERKTIVEEENPKRKTTTWMRVTRVY